MGTTERTNLADELEGYFTGIYDRSECAVNLLSLVYEMLDWPLNHNGEQHPSCLGTNPVSTPKSLLETAKYLLTAINEYADRLLMTVEKERGVK
jgi:hypothetical protein